MVFTGALKRAHADASAVRQDAKFRLAVDHCLHQVVKDKKTTPDCTGEGVRGHCHEKCPDAGRQAAPVSSDLTINLRAATGISEWRPLDCSEEE